MQQVPHALLERLFGAPVNMTPERSRRWQEASTVIRELLRNAEPDELNQLLLLGLVLHQFEHEAGARLGAVLIGGAHDQMEETFQWDGKSKQTN